MNSMSLISKKSVSSENKNAGASQNKRIAKDCIAKDYPIHWF